MFIDGHCMSCLVLIVYRAIMPLPIIFLIYSYSFGTTGITVNSYCDQQLKQLELTINKIKQNCSINDITIKTCGDINDLYFFTNKFPAVYQMQCWCGGKWSTTSVFCDTQTADGGWTVIQRRKRWFCRL